jgi:hypothetical protein
MVQELDKPLLDLERHSTNYPLFFLGGFVFVCTGTVIVLAAGLGAWAMLVFGLFAAAGLLAMWYFSSMRTAAGAEAFDWLPVPPDVQKQSLALEVQGIAGTLELDPWQTTELFSAYIVAEDLAFRRIQHEQNAPVIRHAQIGKTPFDGLIIKRDLVICVEVVFLVRPEIRPERVSSMLKKSAAVNRHFRSERIERGIRLLIVLVTQISQSDNERLRRILGRDLFAETSVDIDIRVLDFEELQRSFLTER